MEIDGRFDCVPGVERCPGSVGVAVRSVTKIVIGLLRDGSLAGQRFCFRASCAMPPR